ncbi:von Willebrand factor C and EGF domain-containing protein-like [Diabrotica undecimpunctata]|uniref:von Willebrand factor C and EGF domain-containing protein-like n=1 Tax=Diabrotica undecimpunctata TaxID=50387 RepID=UPI003B6329FA
MTLLTWFIYFLFVVVSYGDIDNPACDQIQANLYADLGCKPIYSKCQKCPVRYDCNLEPKEGSCLFRGKYIPIGEALSDNDTLSTCYVGCFCSEEQRFICAILDCWFPIPEEKPNCYTKWELDQCCPGEDYCYDECHPPHTCLVDGKTYREGEIFFPKDSCHRCVCKKGFNGKIEAPFCKRQACLAQYQFIDQLNQYCAPIYNEGSDCCAYEWLCPSSNDKKLPSIKKPCGAGLTCKYGKKVLKVGDRFESKIINYDNTTTPVQCECDVPPLVTCRKS